MDLEELTKTQIVLLTLLITFVTSIATGIVTVTLMDQAPPAVTQTINRVVERTVERVVPSDIGGKETVVREKEVTVVVKEDDLITDSIERNKNKLVRLYLESDVTTTGSEEEGNLSTIESPTENTFIGLGIIVSKDGLISTSRVTARSALSLKALTSDGDIFDTEIVNTDEEFKTGLLKIVFVEGEEQTFTPVDFLGSDGLKLGQTVIALSGEDRTNVSMGIVSDLVYVEEEVPVGVEGETETITRLSRIETNIISNSINGSPILNIFGEIIGLKTSTSASMNGSFTPIHVIKSQITSSVAETAEVIETDEITG